MQFQYYRIKQLTEILSISKSTIYSWMNKNTFPKPIKLGRISVWEKSDIDAFINAGKQQA